MLPPSFGALSRRAATTALRVARWALDRLPSVVLYVKLLRAWGTVGVVQTLYDTTAATPSLMSARGLMDMSDTEATRPGAFLLVRGWHAGAPRAFLLSAEHVARALPGPMWAYSHGGLMALLHEYVEREARRSPFVAATVEGGIPPDAVAPLLGRYRSSLRLPNNATPRALWAAARADGVPVSAKDPGSLNVRVTLQGEDDLEEVELLDERAAIVPAKKN